ncbi:globin-coupled sensor protein [Ponticaulis sp.]|uniref:globin-coupled sensor protein n=1 Tax=Ponticaulis sp. TaxID=2020902 RepID=UPI00261D6031|nr:globin-coupled sensor protein [Ponticaulis sp.]MDF1678939.1 globin-coupled sensor protein [Ponticaulis sp.]
MSTSTDLSSRLNFLRLDLETITTLRELRAPLEDILPNVLRDFYAHVAKYPEIERFFDSKERLDFAANAQFRHWKVILTGDFSPEYIKSVKTIGTVHARIGLEPQFYLAGYTFLVDEALRRLGEKFINKRKLSVEYSKLHKMQSAFIRAAMLDMDLSIHFFNEVRRQEAQQKTLDMADLFEKEVQAVSGIVSAAAVELEANSRQMTEIAESTYSRSADLSASILQASNGVEAASRSTEELGNAVGEIAERSAEATKVTASSATTADEANQTIQRLSASADKVSEVVSLISDIAAQTNLLALNATIESARAGEAGKGFAVVASEVKTLANETAKATEEISRHIQEMLDTTNSAVNAIASIQASITEVNSVSLSINAAIEEQTSSTREIARNTREAAVGARSVSDSIEEVSRSAESTKNVSEQVVQASADLGRQATTLQGQVNDFLAHIRAS